MTAETLKPFLTLPTTNQNSKTKNLSVRSIILLFCAIFVVIFCVAISCLEIWNSVKTSELRQEVDQLKSMVDEMRKYLGYDILDELSNFEDAYDSSEDEEILDDDYDEAEFDLDGKILSDVKVQNNAEPYDNESGDDDEEGEESSGLFGIPEYNKDDSAYGGKNDAYMIVKNRKVRSIAGLTRQGVPIIEEPYALRRNNTQSTGDDYYNQINNDPKLKLNWKGNSEIPREDEKYVRKYKNNHRPSSSLSHSSAYQVYVQPNNNLEATTKPPRPVQARRSRVMQTNEDKSQAFRQTIKKSDFARFNDFMEQKKPQEHHVYPRRRMMRQMKKRPQPAVIAVHYEGDGSRHYDPRVKLTENKYMDWKAAAWLNSAATDRFFKMSRDGVLTVNEGGLYFIYAQILYDDDHDTNGYIINHNAQPFLQCTTMTHSQTRITKTNTCYTGSLIHLRVGDALSIRDIGNHRFILMEGNKTFFGLVRMGHIRTPNESGEANQ